MKSSTIHNAKLALIIAAFLSLHGPAPLHADDDGPLPVTQAAAPDKTVELSGTSGGGAYFVNEGLKKDYDKILAQMSSLRNELDNGRITGVDAKRDLAKLQYQLSTLQKKIQEAKVLVSPLKVHKQSETLTFDLGPSRMLIVTGDDIQVEGWDESGVKCVLEKSIYAPDGVAVEDHLAGLKVEHALGIARDIVGRSKEEVDADETKFLNTDDGRKLNEQQRASRKAFVRQIADSYSEFAGFQGTPIDTIRIHGLTHDEGNRWALVKVTSPNGGGYSGGDWQRHARLIVYVPKCNALALRGCLKSLDLKGVQAAVVLSRTGSQNRDYDGTFKVKDVIGSLNVQNVPLDLVQDVRGPVNIIVTQELANTGATHNNGQRVLYSPPPRLLTIRDIDGGVSIRATRADLVLERIRGAIDVQNDFGSTMLKITEKLPAVAHRVISEAGGISIELPVDSMKELPLMAATNCGTLRTDVDQKILPDFNMSFPPDDGGTVADWRGLNSDQKRDSFSNSDRIPLVLKGANRTAGLDIISRGGWIWVEGNAKVATPQPK